jgi:hypothetical protein
MPEKEQSDVRIISWPEQSMAVTHEFKLEEPCPVVVSFDDTPANVTIRTDPQHPLDVNMNMLVSAGENFPVCIKLCEPICAESRYQIGIVIFDRPVATITIKGITRLFNCDEEV